MRVKAMKMTNSVTQVTANFGNVKLSLLFQKQNTASYEMSTGNLKRNFPHISSLEVKN